MFKSFVNFLWFFKKFNKGDSLFNHHVYEEMDKEQGMISEETLKEFKMHFKNLREDKEELNNLTFKDFYKMMGRKLNLLDVVALMA